MLLIHLKNFSGINLIFLFRSKPFSRAHLEQLEVERVSSPVLSTGPLESEEVNEEEDEVDSETLLGSTQVMMGIPEDEPAAEASSTSPVLLESSLKSEDEKIEPKSEPEVPEAASPTKRGRGRRGAAKPDVASPIPEVKSEDSGVRRSGRATKPSTKISSDDFVSDPFIHDQPITPSRRSRKSLPEVEKKEEASSADLSTPTNQKQPLAKEEIPDQQGNKENGTSVKLDGKVKETAVEDDDHVESPSKRSRQVAAKVDSVTDSQEKKPLQKKGKRSKAQVVQNDSELASGSENGTVSKETVSNVENIADATSSVEKPSEEKAANEAPETAVADDKPQVSSPSKATGRKGKRGSKLEVPAGDKVVDAVEGSSNQISEEVKATTGSLGGGRKRGSKAETETDEGQATASPNKRGKGKPLPADQAASGSSQRSKRFRLSEGANDGAIAEQGNQTEEAEETAGKIK